MAAKGVGQTKRWLQKEFSRKKGGCSKERWEGKSEAQKKEKGPEEGVERKNEEESEGEEEFFWVVRELCRRGDTQEKIPERKGKNERVGKGRDFFQ